MSSWGEFAEARPDMMKLLLEILDWIPITYLATVRDDGAPRVHPVCPIIAEGRMFVAVAATSPKRLDLKRDGRYAMHALPGKWREVDGQTRGDPESPLRWICKSTRTIAKALARRKHPVPLCGISGKVFGLCPLRALRFNFKYLWLVLAVFFGSATGSVR